MIIGNQIDLRPARAQDLVQLRQWESDPRIAHWLGTTATALDSRESPDQEYDRLLRTPRIKLLAIQRKDATVVGFLRINDIDQIDRKAVIRIFVAPEYQRQRFASDAIRTALHFCFRELGLHRIGLVVRADNIPARAIYERIGFHQEGIERDALWSDGHWVSFLHMGILENELHEGDQPC